MKKKIFIFLLLLVLLFIFRINILQAFGRFLVKENIINSIETAFVLSGHAYDRGNEAIRLLKQDKISHAVCTGGNMSPNFKALDIEMLESELTRRHILSQIADSSKVSLLKEGTSTLEESEAILAYCKKHQIKRCLIVSSKFHTRRIKSVFVKKFEKQGIQVFIKGAPSSDYNEAKWWQSENGLIALNNEYVKLLYYAIKY